MNSSSSIRDKAAKGLVWNFLGKLHFAVVRYLESVILVRLLGATEYALFSGALNINALAVLISALGIETAIARFFTQYKAQSDFPRARSFFWSALLMRTILQTLTAFLIFIFADKLALNFLGGSDKAYLVKAAALLSLSMAIQSFFVRVLVSLYLNKFLNLVAIAVYSAYLAIIWWLSKSGYDASAVLWAYFLLMTVMAVVVGLRMLREFPIFGPLEKNFEFKRILAFSGFLYVFSLLSFVLGKGLDILLLGKLAKQIEEITYYTLGYNLAFFTVGFFGLALTEGFATSLTSEVASTRPEKIRELYNSQFEYLFFFAIPVGLGGMIVARDLIVGFYGEKVIGAVAVAMIYFPFFIYSKLGAISSTFLPILDKERVLVGARLVYGFFNALINIILIPRYGAFGATVGTSITSFFGIAYETYVLHKLVRPNYPWKFLLKTLASAIVMCCVALLVTVKLSCAPLLRAGLAIFSGAIVYGVMVIILKPISELNADLLVRTGLPFSKTIAKLISQVKKG